MSKEILLSSDYKMGCRDACLMVERKGTVYTLKKLKRLDAIGRSKEYVDGFLNALVDIINHIDNKRSSALIMNGKIDADNYVDYFDDLYCWIVRAYRDDVLETYELPCETAEEAAEYAHKVFGAYPIIDISRIDNSWRKNYEL